MLPLLLVACVAKPGDAPKESIDTALGGDTSDSDTSEIDSTDTGTPVVGPGIVVLAGGGSEGEVDDPASWSARLYPQLWAGGDVTGDGLVRVLILSAADEDEWLPEYFESLGVDDAFNLRAMTSGAAQRDDLAETFAEVDAVFIKGGDQGEYYDLWNDTLLEEQIRLVHETRGGGIGGTSAGAMSLAQYALAGGMDLVSADVLEDSYTEYLDDATDGGSGIHDDFLGFVLGYVVDTHFTDRGRLGRLVGTMAKAREDAGLSEIRGLGCEEQTGVWIQDGVATVVGVGAVAVVTGDGAAYPLRESRVPLTWEGVRLDRLTDGWRFDVATSAVDTENPPSDAEPVVWDGASAPTTGEWYVDGDVLDHEERFAWVVERRPDAYSEHEGADRPVLGDAIGVMDATDSDRRGPAEEAVFRSLYDHVGTTGFFVGYGGSVDRVTANTVACDDNPEVNDPPMACIVIDTSGVTWRSLSPEASLQDAGDGSLHAAGLVGAVVHVLYTPSTTLTYDTVARTVLHAR